MWVKIDDGFATHPKILAAGPLAALVQIRAICFASQNQTDGFIPASAVPLLILGFDRLGVDEGRIGDYASFGNQASDIDWPAVMIEYGLWDAREHGYYIHDYLEWNLSKKDRELFLKQKSKAGKKGMKARWTKGNRSITPVITDDITKPYHTTSTSTSSSLSEFEQFWNAYPKKIAKQDALKAWGKAKAKPPLDRLLAVLSHAKASTQWTKEGGQFIPNPATWLNQGRWDDEYTVPAPRKERLPL